MQHDRPSHQDSRNTGDRQHRPRENQPGQKCDSTADLQRTHDPHHPRCQPVIRKLLAQVRCAPAPSRRPLAGPHNPDIEETRCDSGRDNPGEFIHTGCFECLAVDPQTRFIRGRTATVSIAFFNLGAPQRPVTPARGSDPRGLHPARKLATRPPAPICPACPHPLRYARNRRATTPRGHGSACRQIFPFPSAPLFANL